MTTDAAELSTSPARGRRSCLRIFVRLVIVGAVVLVLLAIGTALAAYMAYDYVTRPGVPGELVRIEIPEGRSGKQVATLLADSGLVDHELFFRAAIRLDNSGMPIKHGVYDLPSGLSPVEQLNLLQEGPNVAQTGYRITIPEGLTLTQIAERFENPQAFINAASDPDLIESLGIDAPTLEGFLMPNTYFFERQPAEAEVVGRMVEHFQNEYNRLTAELPSTPGRNLLELVTVASLVEEESRVEEERPLVAAVIYNRIARGMPLDMDSTLQYALRKYGQRMVDSDKDVQSPYNTYRNAGLPPGPISNPGAAALRAAMQPAGVDYLYFVSNADGKTHTFSSTLAEHNTAVARFRKEIAIQRRQQEEQRANGEEAEH